MRPPIHALLALFLTLLVAACASTQEREFNDNVAEANFKLGIGYMQSGHFEVATEKLLKALQFKDNYPEAHNAIAVLYEHRKPGGKNPIEFTSPWRGTKVDDVRQLPEARITVKTEANGYTVTAASLTKASIRIRSYLRSVGYQDPDPVPDGLIDLTCAIAQRIASIPQAVLEGQQQKQQTSSQFQQGVTYGWDAWKAKRELDRSRSGW